jgi:hypothetical protein
MKTLTFSLFSLLFGVGIGWYLGCTRPVVEANRDALQKLHVIQNDDRETAVFGLAAIQLIDSGDTQKAIQVLAQPIGIYYRLYALNAETSDERTEMRKSIEKLASTDPIVATEIQKKEWGVTDAQVDVVWDPPWSADRISAEGKSKLGMI